MNNELLSHLDEIHTTSLGAERIRKNLNLNITDIVVWSKPKIENANSIIRKGKNWYVHVDDFILTINAHSFTIITAHKEKGRENNMEERIVLQTEHITCLTKFEWRNIIRKDTFK